MERALVFVALVGVGGVVASTIAGLDDVCFERDGAGPAVELEEETAGVAENLAALIAAPQGGRGGLAVLTDGRGTVVVIVSLAVGAIGSVATA